MVTIDCSPEVPGKFEEDLVIDITDRNMQQYPHGVIYRLTSEASFPSLTHTIETFEEHTIIQNLSVLDPRMVWYIENFFFILLLF